jgi:para-aminobenzoate synthetase
MVSTVRGKLSPSASVADVLHSSFPGGSMTGAPKKRTMEIISELEGEERGVYSGSIGYLGVDGRASLNIVIRTAVVDEKGDGGVSVGCGGAITWLSDEGAEYDEMRLKGRVVEQTVLDALGLANSGEGEGGASGGGAGRGGWYAAPQKSRPATVQVAAKANDIDETP